MPDVETIFGLRRAAVYDLIAEGKIRSAKNGRTRLIEVESVREYLRSLMEGGDDDGG